LATTNYSICNIGETQWAICITESKKSREWFGSSHGEAFHQSLDTDFGGQGWQTFRKALDIRDRLTHPETFDNCHVVYFEEYCTRSEATKREEFFKSGQGREWISENITNK
jgi:hypothetical protein